MYLGSLGTSGWGWRNIYQKTPHQREEEYMLRGSLWNHKPWRLVALLNLQKLINSGHQGAAEPAQGLQHTLAPTVGHVTHTTSKKAAAAIGGQRLQGSTCKHTCWNEGPRLWLCTAAWKPLDCGYEPLFLSEPLGLASPLLLQLGDHECVHLGEAVAACTMQLSAINNNSLINKQCSNNCWLWSVSSPDSTPYQWYSQHLVQKSHEST